MYLYNYENGFKLVAAGTRDELDIYIAEHLEDLTVCVIENVERSADSKKEALTRAEYLDSVDPCDNDWRELNYE